MNEHLGPGLRHISWNGLSLNIPQSWEVRPAGNQHLIIERSFRAVCEIRWQNTAATSSERPFKSARDQYAKLTGTTLHLQKPPPPLRDALSNFDVQYCRVENSATALVLLLHKSSGTHVMIQLHDNADRSDLMSVLVSICCRNPEEEESTWNILDFQVYTPAGYRLERFTMEAGLSALFLEKSGSLLQICRMAPADLRLQKSSLQEIFAALLGLPVQEIDAGDGDDRIVYRNTPSILRQIGMRLRRKKPFLEAAFWHNHQANRLQGVFHYSVHPPAPEVHSRICASYEILPL